MLKGKVAIVTGSGRGIGRSIAEKLGENGASLLICDIDQETTENTAKELAKQGMKTLGVKCDVTNAVEVDAMVKACVEEFGGVDILVNNAGVTRDGLLMRMKEEDWDMVLNVNLKSAFLCTKSASRYLIKSKSGRVINIASVVGIMGNAGQANYAASKGGIIAFTKTVAKEFASKKVTSNAIAPGFIQTPMTDKLSDDQKDKLSSVIPLKELGLPEDVAASVLFFASDLSSYVTGQVLAVDGGMTM